MTEELHILSRPGLKALRLKLLYDLWLREDRVYAHLHKALEEELTSLRSITRS